ncbi:putative enzyme [Rubidibacter lacunae KORDI 51-2]|uniref:Putative enzyme n=1 Tax=Rubidibacter lacunae KORDI 51-2 TaxID=582515 RepID=U5DJZ7_9CHRO|nr:VOC family protein [Rubidibacter lacunae]ERN40904.1 putative enzyme [Rubidibacter lacunae KORDI 51-2]
MVTEMIAAIYVDDLTASRNFYRELLGLQPIFEAEWICQLSSPSNESLKLILQPREHELIPKAFQERPKGTSIAFIVPDSDEIYQRAVAMGLEIIQEPRNEEYGRRRFLTVDPDRLLVDVSSDCEPSPDFVAKYMNFEE